MSLFKRARSEFWYVDICRPGRSRLRCSTGERDRESAQRKHDELAARIWSDKQKRPLQDALAAWIKARPRSSHELSNVKQINEAFPRAALADVTEAKFMAAFADKTPGTYNRIGNTLRSALKMAVRAGMLTAAPEIQRRKVDPYDPHFLGADEWERLYAELPPHLQPMAAFAVATGLRWANVAALTWERVDIRRKIAWIPAGKAKARKPIAVPLSSAAIEALRSIEGERTGFVFTYAGKPLRSPKTAFLKARKRAGLENVRWHDFRHTWASWHVMGGTPLAVLQELGGWQTADMVKRYAHLTPGHVAAFADNARPPKASRKRAA